LVIVVAVVVVVADVVIPIIVIVAIIVIVVTVVAVVRGTSDVHKGDVRCTRVFRYTQATFVEKTNVIVGGEESHHLHVFRQRGKLVEKGNILLKTLGAGHTGHKELRHSVAEADIGHSVAGNGHIDAAEAGVGDAEVEARMTHTAYGMVVGVVDVSGDVSDALAGVVLGSGERVDVEAGGGLAAERDVGEEAERRTYDVVVAGPEDNQGLTVEAEGRWPWNVDGDRTS
jgi:hypothetical protein